MLEFEVFAAFVRIGDFERKNFAGGVFHQKIQVDLAGQRPDGHLHAVVFAGQRGDLFE